MQLQCYTLQRTARETARGGADNLHSACRRVDAGCWRMQWAIPTSHTLSALEYAADAVHLCGLGIDSLRRICSAADSRLGSGTQAAGMAASCGPWWPNSAQN